MIALDRRKEHRYIPAGLRAEVGGESCPILDVSRSAIRVLRPAQSLALRGKISLRFAIDEHPVHGSLSFAVEAQVVRENDRHVVLRYKAPTSDWEDIIKSLDIFDNMSIEQLF
jgi:hypothetical protein